MTTSKIDTGAVFKTLETVKTNDIEHNVTDGVYAIGKFQNGSDVFFMVILTAGVTLWFNKYEMENETLYLLQDERMVSKLF